MHARCEELHRYSRGEVAQPPATISVSDVGSTAFSIVPKGLLDEVKEEIDRLAATNKWPEW